VSWNYSGNADNSFGSSSATNFSISPTDQNAFEGDLPNDIASPGAGSTEITGVTPGHPESFNVQAAGQWTIKVAARTVTRRGASRATAHQLHHLLLRHVVPFAERDDGRGIHGVRQRL
jgi:hypothetical protein